jgi:hypothetical protein
MGSSSHPVEYESLKADIAQLADYSQKHTTYMCSMVSGELVGIIDVADVVPITSEDGFRLEHSCFIKYYISTLRSLMLMVPPAHRN